MTKHARKTDNPRRVAVVGGGITGLMCAWRSAQRGHDVTLFEKNTIGSGCSNFSLGGLVPYIPTRQHDTAKFQRESLRIYPEVMAELTQFTGLDTGYVAGGRVQLLFTQDKRDGAELDLSLNPTQGHIIEQQDLRAHYPFINADIAPFGAFICKETAYVDVPKIMSALHQACLKSGVIIKEHHFVSITDIEASFDHIILTTGCWTNDILPPESSTEHQIEAMMGHGIEIQLSQQIFTQMVRIEEIYAIPHADGRVVLGSDTVRAQTTQDWLPQKDIIHNILNRAYAMIPELQHGTITKIWRAPRPKAKRKQPLIKALTPKLTHATGHYKIGYCVAPKVGLDILHFIENKND